MSSPTDVVRFVEHAPCVVVISVPAIGYTDVPTAVSYAASRGDLLVWNRASDHIAATGVRVKDTIQQRDEIHVVESEFPYRMFTFRKPQTQDEEAMVRDVTDALEDVEPLVKSALTAALDSAPAPSEETLKPVSFARWQEFQDGKLVPAGVVLYEDAHGRFIFHGFAHAHDMAAIMSGHFTGWDGDEKSAWVAMRERLTRNTALAVTESIMAPSFESALARALYRYAEDHWTEHGESLIS